MRWRTLTTCVLTMLVAIGSAPADDDVPPVPETDGPTWHNDFRQATRRAKKEGRPRVLLFTTSWCGVCKELKRETLRDEAVRKALSRMVLVELDLDDEGVEVARQLGVRRVPTLVILDERDQVLHGSVGYISAEALLVTLERVLGRYGGLEPPEVVRYRNRMVNLLVKGEPDEAQWRGLFEFLARRRGDRVLEQAIETRRPFPARRLVALLGAPRLDHRMLGFQMLADVSGEEFGYDPWLDPDASAEARARWETWAKRVEADGLPSKRFVHLSEQRIRELLGDLVSDDPRRRNLARRRLAGAGQPGAQVIVEAGRRAGLSTMQRARLHEVLLAIKMPPQLESRRLELARKLVFGNIEDRVVALDAVVRGGRSSAMPVLKDLSTDTDAAMRETMIEKLAWLDTPEAHKVLLGMVDEKDLNVKVTLLVALAGYPGQESFEVLEANLDGPEQVVVAAMKALAEWPDKHRIFVRQPLVKRLRDVLKHESWRVRAQALSLVSAWQLKDLSDAVVAALDDPDSFVCKKAIEVCGSWDLAKARPRLLEMARKQPELRPMLVPILGAALGHEKLVELVMSSDDDVLLRCVDALAEYNEALCYTVADKLLESDKTALRLAGLRSIGVILQGYRREVVKPEMLKKVLALTDPSCKPEVRREALAVLVNTRNPEALQGRAQRSTGLGLLLGGGGLFSSGAGLSRSIHRRMADLLDADDPVLRRDAARVLMHAGLLDGLPVLKELAESSKTAPQLRSDILEWMLLVLSTRPVMLGFPPEEVASDPKALEARRQAVHDEATALFVRCLGASQPNVVTALSRQALRFNATELLPGVFKALEKKTLDPMQLLESLDERRANYYRTGSAPPGRPSDKAVREWAVKTISAKDPVLRRTATACLATVGRPEDVERLDAMFASDDSLDRRTALVVLAALDLPKARARARGILDKGSPELVCPAIELLVPEDEQWDLVELPITEDEYHGVRVDFSKSKNTKAAVKSLFDDPFASRKESAGLDRNLASKLTGLMKNSPSTQVRYRAGLALLKNRIEVDYTPMVEAFSTMSTEDYGFYSLLRVLENWTRVPAEFYPLLSDIGRNEQGWKEEVTQLVRRIDRNALRRYDQAEVPDYEQMVLREPATTRSVLPDRPVGPASADASYSLVVFYQVGCRHCRRVSELVDRLQHDFAGLQVRQMNIRPPESATLNELLAQRAGIPQARRQVVPAVFSSTHGLVGGEQIDMESLVRLTLTSENQPPPWQIEELSSDRARALARQNIRRRYDWLGVLSVIGLGLGDGINPCAFTVIIFFLSYLTYVGRSRRDLLVTGLLFTAGVFVTYLLVGFGMLAVVDRLKFLPTVASVVYWVTAIFALLVGVLSFRDGILCLRGRVRDVSLQLPGKLKNAIHKVIRKQTRMGTIVVASLVTGFTVSLLELACTGQVYLPSIIMISKGRVAGTLLLILYNLAFILPLVIIFVAAYFGLSSQRLTEFFQRHVAAVKFMLAGLFFGLFAFLVVTM